MSTAGKVIKCKAAVAWEPKKPLTIEEIEVAPPQAHEVRLKVVATGVCHSDYYILYEGGKEYGFPCVLGHEGAGIVESVGPGVTRFKPGDKVIPLFVSQCAECPLCLSDKTNQCVKNWTVDEKNMKSKSRFTCKGKVIIQFMGTSTFSEYTVVPEEALTKIPDSAPLDKVCLLGCGISTGYGAAINTAKRSALESTKRAWGVSVIVGWVDVKDVSTKPVDLICGRTWKGSYFGGWKSVQSVPKLVSDYMEKKIKVDEFITHTMPLEKVNEAFELMVTGKSIRTVLKM
ncbi:alcohol dehydrogenase 1-like isoform X2 [Polypterus senegalus]|uniref:alcohol dehydrogenase 1-like isoform X2 n=1 Tax=Polypterus senegalus TaxID=55291 RepID=UPI0019669418|nr:alcohol dehydrogenase 1-like isoform X2 [Polypterus senegalus]